MLDEMKYVYTIGMHLGLSGKCWGGGDRNLTYQLQRLQPMYSQYYKIIFKKLSCKNITYLP